MFEFIVIRADRDSGLFDKDLFLALPLMLTSMVVYAIPHTAEVPTARLLARLK